MKHTRLMALYLCTAPFLSPTACFDERGNTAPAISEDTAAITSADTPAATLPDTETPASLPPLLTLVDLQVKLTLPKNGG